MGENCSLIILKDITSEMRLTKMMNEKQFQDLITATVSHDMKTPLNSIIMTSEQLAEFTNENPLSEKLRKINLSAGKLLFSLVSDLLDLY
jgi:two-component system chemotaxis sensor kinase CheA